MLTTGCMHAGVNTPRVSVPGTGPDRAMSSDAHVSPRTLEADSWKAGSGPGSKHSSLSSHEASTAQNSLRNENTAQVGLLTRVCHGERLFELARTSDVS